MLQWFRFINPDYLLFSNNILFINHYICAIYNFKTSINFFNLQHIGERYDKARITLKAPLILWKSYFYFPLHLKNTLHKHLCILCNMVPVYIFHNSILKIKSQFKTGCIQRSISMNVDTLNNWNWIKLEVWLMVNVQKVQRHLNTLNK